MRRRAYVLVLCTAALSAVPLTVQSQTSVESELLDYINRGRSSPLTPHAGLLIVARGHSSDMSQRGDLNHDGAGSRIGSAAPDPAERNSAPDDGFSGMWCENVAYVSGAPAEEVAQRMYAAWTESPSHNRCMNEGHMNVAGLGIYQDGKRWWATLELAVDRSLPGSGSDTREAEPAPAPAQSQPAAASAPEPAPPEPTPAPAVEEEPVPLADLIAGLRPSAFRTVAEDGKTTVETYRTQIPAPTTRVAASAPKPAAPRVLAISARRAAHRHVVWPELMGTLAALVLLAEGFRRLGRRPQTRL